MSQDPNVVYVQSPRNSMGLAGFIVSLVGYFTGGLLCPVGLVLSLIGLRKQPRGFAVAGVILGAIGTIGGIILFIVVGFVGVIGCCGGVCGGLAPHLITKVHIGATAKEVEQFERTNNRLPATLEEISDKHRRSRRDGWDRPLHLILENDGTFTITSDGPDGVANTGDDVRENRSVGKHAI